MGCPPNESFLVAKKSALWKRGRRAAGLYDWKCLFKRECVNVLFKNIHLPASQEAAVSVLGTAYVFQQQGRWISSLVNSAVFGADGARYQRVLTAAHARSSTIRTKHLRKNNSMWQRKKANNHCFLLKKKVQQLETHTSHERGSVQRSLKQMKVDCAAQMDGDFRTLKWWYKK